MDRNTFIEALQSGLGSQIRTALENPYIPQAVEDVEILAEIAHLPNSYLQNLIFNIGKKIRTQAAIPALASLAHYGITTSVRRGSVDELIQLDCDQARAALLRCTMDEDIGIQQQALAGLQGWSNPEAINLLLDTLANPGALIAPNHRIDLTEIQRFAIKGLATPGVVVAVEPLVQLMFENRGLQQLIVESLIVIDTPEVAEELLREIELIEQAQDSHLDLASKLNVVTVISQLSHNLETPIVDQYRNLLAELVGPASHQGASHFHVFQESSKYINDTLAASIQQTIQQHLPQGTARHIAQHIGVLVLLEWIDYWHFEHYTQQYLDALWQVAEPEEYGIIIQSLCNIDSDSEYAIEHSARFMGPRLLSEISSGDTPTLIVDLILRFWQDSPESRDTVQAVLSLAEEFVPSKEQWVMGLLERSPQDPSDEIWVVLEQSIQSVDEELRINVYQEFLSDNWNQRLIEELINLRPAAGADLLRYHLWDSWLSGLEREWAILALGGCGQVNDFRQLSGEISGDSEQFAVVAVKAIGAIDAEEGQLYLRETLQSRKREAVLAALAVIEGVNQIESETVYALRERAQTSERDNDIRELSSKVLETLKHRHIHGRPPISEEINHVRNWIHTLATFEKDDETCAALSDLLSELGDREAPEFRIAIANHIADCCPAEKALEIAERESDVERRRNVVVAWETAIDDIRGLPDRGIMHLVERVCDTDIDRNSLLGDWSLVDLISDPDELHLVNTHLRRAEVIKLDPDSLIPLLDSAAELLVDQILLVEGDDPKRFDKYSNKIGFVKQFNTRVWQFAQGLHSLRELALGPHPRNASGQGRTGASPTDGEEAKRFFFSLFDESLTHLRQHKEANP